MTWDHVGGMQGGGNRQSHKWELSLSALWPWPAAVYLKYLIMNTMAAAGSGSVADKSQGSWRWRDKKRGWASEHELAPFHHPQLAFTVARVKMLQSTLLARCPIYRGLQFLHQYTQYSGKCIVERIELSHFSQVRMIDHKTMMSWVGFLKGKGARMCLFNVV